MRRTVAVLLGAIVIGGLARSAVAQQPPPPQPFPRPGGSAPPPASPAPPPPTPPAPTPAAPKASPAPAAGPTKPGAPTEAMLGPAGVIYPTSEFLESFDIGRGQRCYLFGTNASQPEVVAYYKQTLRDGGRELFKYPAMQQFDLGKFQEQTMTAQPAVVVKDYGLTGGEGYLFVDGTQSKRFKTVIQIVPAVPAPAR